MIEGKQGKEVVVGLNDLTMLRYKGVNVVVDYGKGVGVPVSMCQIGEALLVGTQEGTVALY